MNIDVEAAIDASGEPDARARITRLVAALSNGMADSLPLGRKLIRLTVDAPPADGPRRGYRRIDWIEQLVSALAVVIGWEAFIVLFDVRGLSADQARETLTGAAITHVDAALAQAGTGTGTDSDSPN